MVVIFRYYRENYIFSMYRFQIPHYRLKVYGSILVLWFLIISFVFSIYSFSSYALFIFHVFLAVVFFILGTLLKWGTDVLTFTTQLLLICAIWLAGSMDLGPLNLEG
ncbi:hypothetical protein PanWU01x14_337660 [Parasponia andersonii]|uniref:Transmembrane protein n=1 Tax=Parasponia andersonii TaxID=3476 RepID=A0A2P5AFH4_PARAD|nr:hypothetical protein PanWU01x14_337660 [Parasponia andersonii]